MREKREPREQKTVQLYKKIEATPPLKSNNSPYEQQRLKTSFSSYKNRKNKTSFGKNSLVENLGGGDK